MGNLKQYKILTINPGSTSTKIRLFAGDDVVFSANVELDPSVIARYDDICDSMPYQIEVLCNAFNEAGVSIDDIDAAVGRGGGLVPCEGGVYEVDELVLKDAMLPGDGVHHPAQLGSLLAKYFANQAGVPCYVVNPPSVDEIQDKARITGIKGVNRFISMHALNLKEMAIRHAERQGKQYEDMNLIVCHLGGGVSVSAHLKGRMVDGYGVASGDGPMSPTRCGAVPVSSVADWIDIGHTTDDVRMLCQKTGGFISHFCTSDSQEVCRRVRDGEAHAALVWDAFCYQVGKCIGSMASVLSGDVDAILLGGGIAHSAELVEFVRKSCGFMAPIFAYPGEFEMEAMKEGASRVLNGKEKSKQYTGIPAFSGFPWDK